LWLSAVVPLASDAILRRALPLAAGLAVCASLQELGVSHFRLRWPNDVLVIDRKLAGLLIDQFSQDLAVIGIGMNVGNRPESMDPDLSNRTVRLADLLGKPVELSDLTALLLRHLRQELATLESAGAPALFARVNGFWHEPRMVELDLDGAVRKGMFKGVDASGRLTLESPSGELSFYDAHEVRHLTETEKL
jgi:BirA family biotin operon repressor/biotin-[acetyl-CoA-carboxylase] ligase